jgi:hypothetical protein
MCKKKAKKKIKGGGVDFTSQAPVGGPTTIWFSINVV